MRYTEKHRAVRAASPQGERAAVTAAGLRTPFSQRPPPPSSSSSGEQPSTTGLIKRPTGRVKV